MWSNPRGAAHCISCRCWPVGLGRSQQRATHPEWLSRWLHEVTIELVIVNHKILDDFGIGQNMPQ
jgi:hypothetical protein